MVSDRDDVPQGGFAGIVEKQMVISPKLMPGAVNRKDISHGLGDFIYLSSGHFKLHDGAPLHPHDNVDIVTVVLSGSIAHAGTLGDGTMTMRRARKYNAREPVCGTRK